MRRLMDRSCSTSVIVSLAEPRSIARLYVRRDPSSAKPTVRASERFGVASQSDVADDRVSAEKAPPTRQERCSWLGQAHQQAGRIQATPTIPARRVGEHQTESGAIVGYNEDDAMPPPNSHPEGGQSGGRERRQRETEMMHGRSPRDRRKSEGEACEDADGRFRGVFLGDSWCPATTAEAEPPTAL